VPHVLGNVVLGRVRGCRRRGHDAAINVRGVARVVEGIDLEFAGGAVLLVLETEECTCGKR
jgi:hypothetical protein